MFSGQEPSHDSIMSLWEEVAVVTSHAGGLFHGYSPLRLMVMFQSLADSRIMRYTTDVGATNKSQRKDFESGFQSNFELTESQFQCLAGIYDRNEIGDVRSACEKSLPASTSGVRPTHVRKCFAPDKSACCGHALRVSTRLATVYGRDECFSAWNVVKTCRRGCKRRYFFDKTLLRGNLDGVECAWHVYHPWEGGHMPEYIASKSGKSIVKSTFLSSVALDQCMKRCVMAVQTKQYAGDKVLSQFKPVTSFPLIQ